MSQPRPQRSDPWAVGGRWTLATQGYCQICRGRTAQSELHEVRDGTEHIETTCLTCHQVTGRQRLPAPGTQLWFEELERRFGTPP